MTKRLDDWNDSQKKLDDENRRLIEQEAELKRSLQKENKPTVQNLHQDSVRKLGRMFRRQISMNDQYYKVDFIPEVIIYFVIILTSLAKIYDTV